MCVPLKIILWGEKKLGEQDWHIHTAMCKMDSWWEAAAQHRQLSSALCDGLEGWDGGEGGGHSKGRGYMYTSVLLNCGVGEVSWESLGLQGDPTSPSWRKSVLGVHWKDLCWSWNFNTLATWCEELTHLKRPWCWERLKAGEGDDRGWDGWMITDSMGMSLSKLQELVMDRES